MVIPTLKIWQQFCWKIFKVHLTILGSYALKGKVVVTNVTTLLGFNYGYNKRSLQKPYKD